VRAGLRSFRSQLILGAVVGVTGMLTICGVALCQLLRQETEYIYRGELQEHAVELEKLVTIDRDGRMGLRAPLSDPRFLNEGSGYYWEVSAVEGRELRSSSLGQDRIELSTPPVPVGGERFGEATNPLGKILFVEQTVRLEGLKSVLRILVAMDAGIVDGISAKFVRVVGLALTLVGVGLISATAAHLYLGFQFLNRVRTALANVRAGRSNRLPEDLPEEVLPLVRDFNALIGVNEEMVRRARMEAGSLAHSLKTPLAILLDEAERLKRTERGEEARRILAQCEKIRRTVEFQLARARASLLQGTTGAVARVDPLVRSGVAALARLHLARGTSFEIGDLCPELTLACAAEDFEEMFLALVDNAAKWAGSRVRISVEAHGEELRLLIDDDGPGVPHSERNRVFEAGARLDEATPGTGFGLSIASEIAGLYGGRVWIEASPLGGARACLELPMIKK
jgi:signal transduction histidine kinase